MTGRPPRSQRILALLDLAEEVPTADELAEFLSDADPDVRRTALSVLSEAAESWEDSSSVFAAALLDPDEKVRGTAIELIGELREVLVVSEEFARSLRTAGKHTDAGVRTAAVGALWRHGLCTVGELTALLPDPDEAFRCELVLGLVSLDALEALDQASADPSSAVRLAVARGLGSVGDPRGISTLTRLALDAAVLVRAAALTAMAATGCTPQAAAVAVGALTDPAWQVRQGAAAALAAVGSEEADGPLIAATRDTNLDVRKASVRALGARLRTTPEIQAALQAARDDADADVRAFARMAFAAHEDTQTEGDD